MRPRARHDGRVRARQNLKMLQMTSFQVYYTFQAILSISKIPARARPRVRARARVFSHVARTECGNAVFSHVLGF